MALRRKSLDPNNSKKNSMRSSKHRLILQLKNRGRQLIIFTRSAEVSPNKLSTLSLDWIRLGSALRRDGLRTNILAISLSEQPHFLKTSVEFMGWSSLTSTKFPSGVPFINAVVAAVLLICVHTLFFATGLSFTDAVMVLIAATGAQTLVFATGVLGIRLKKLLETENRNLSLIQTWGLVFMLGGYWGAKKMWKISRRKAKKWALVGRLTRKETGNQSKLFKID